MGNICVKQKLTTPEKYPGAPSVLETLFPNRKRKIHPINTLNNLKNNFYNIEDNFPDKNDLDSFRKLYYGGWTITTFPIIQNKTIKVRPQTASTRNKFNLNK